MKLDIASDLHLNFFRDFGERFVDSWVPGANTLLLAGDVADRHWWRIAPKVWTSLCAKYEHVLFVAGNHEYYGTSLRLGERFFHELDKETPSLYFLENRVVTIDGVTFAGTTLWFREEVMTPAYSKYMNDFNAIREFTPEVYFKNEAARDFLDSLGEGIDVVLTHHLPSTRSAREPYIGDPLTTLFFVCDQEDTVFTVEPKLWVHGHSHIPVDYQLYHTRVICHPHGYVGHIASKGYKPLTVEV